MPLVSMRQLLDHAAENAYGLPAFNVNNLEQVRTKEAPARVLKSIKDRIDKLQKKIDEKDLSRRTPEPRPDTPEIKDAQDQLDKLQGIYETMQKADGTRDNEAYRKRLDAQMARMQDNEAKGFPPPKPRVPLKLDAESQAKQAAVAKFKRGFEQRRYDAEQARRGLWEKAWDKVVGTTKFFKLMHITTPIRLLGVTVDRLIGTPLEEPVSGLLSIVSPRLADRATIKGHGSLGAVGTFYRSFFTEGLKDGWTTMKPILSMCSFGKLGDINATVGLKDMYETKPHSKPTFTDIPRMLHAAEKAPLLRAAQEMAEHKLRQNAKRPNSPITPEEIGSEAYKEAQRAVGMNDNLVNSAINASLGRMMARGPDGQANPWGVLANAAVEINFPFRRPATNEFAKIFNRLLGAPIGGIRLGLVHTQDYFARAQWAKLGNNPAQRMARYFAKEIETVHPDVANAIFRNIMEGSPGAAMVLLGAATAASWGGLNYLKKRPDDQTPDFGEIMVDGHKVPKGISLGSSLLTAGQLGATTTHMAAEKLRKKDSEPMGVGRAALGASLGIVKAGPFMGEVTRIAHATEGEAGAEKYIGEWLKGNMIPGILNDYAVWADQQNGVPIRRQINRWYDPLLSAIPGERETLNPVVQKGPSQSPPKGTPKPPSPPRLYQGH